MRPRLWKAFAVLSACHLGPYEPATSSGQQIVGGTIDSRDVAVVRVLLGPSSCSGSLIGPRTVLTASHCAVPAGMEQVVSVEVEAGGGAAPLRREIVAQHVHPQWDAATGAHDLLLLQLRDPVPEVEPLPLSPRPLTERDLGREVRVVGYGATEPGTATGKGARREVTLSIRQLLPSRIEAGAEGRQACEGDSGGPALLRSDCDGIEYVVATVSEGDRGCRTTGFYARVDVDAAWIVATARTWDAIDLSGAGGTNPSECAPRVPAGPLDPTPAPETPGASAAGSCAGATAGTLLPGIGNVLAVLGVRLLRKRPRKRRRSVPL